MTFPAALARVRKATQPGQPMEYQPLVDHLRQVAALAGAFAGKVGMPQAGRLMGLLHDLGKYFTEFQNYLLSASGCISPGSPRYCNHHALKGKIDHSTAGAQWLWQQFFGVEKYQPIAQILALCLASHHSGLIDCLAPDAAPGFWRRMAKDDTLTHLCACLERADAALLQEVQAVLTPELLHEVYTAQYAVWKRVCAALPEGASPVDRADNANSADFQLGMLARFLLSCLLDADRLDSAFFEDPMGEECYRKAPRKLWDRLVPRLEAHLATLKPRHAIDTLRSRISEQCARRAVNPPGIFTLTVPTGGGKTLASIRFALRHAQKHGLDRIIYVIPYTSIIEQNAQVVRDILEQDEIPGSIVLEHHSNVFPVNSDGDAGDALADAWEGMAENWDAPIVFTTMVQFLESLFGSGTRHARRMHNLARSVIIFDEIQTLPVRCVHMFCNALDFLVHTCGASAVLCTATQPALHRLPRLFRGSLSLAPEQEIMDNVTDLFAGLRRTEFHLQCEQDMESADVAALALKERDISGSCLVICNTKGWAEKVFAHCAEQGAQPLYYLSTHLCPAHRMAKLEGMKADLAVGRPVLCVSTQLIECGVDISFGSVIRLAAGLDSILQAAGRCNRHGEVHLGRVHIVKTRQSTENLDMLPDIRDGRDIFHATIRVGLADQLVEWDYDFTRPEIIETYFEHYFYRRSAELAYPVSGERDDYLLAMLGSNMLTDVRRQQFMLYQSFAAASRQFQVIGDATRAVLVPYGKGKDIIAALCSTDIYHERKELMRRAQHYSVNVFPGTLAALLRANAVHNIQQSGILSIKEQYYCTERGVITRPDAGQSLCYFGQED